MGGVIDDVAGLWGGGRTDKAIDQQNKQLGDQARMWERQFGPVNDALRSEMMSVLGYTWKPSETSSSPSPTLVSAGGPMAGVINALAAKGDPGVKTSEGEWVKSDSNPWIDKFKSTMRGEIESGIRPGEEAARVALLDKVRASPRSMSSQSYAKGLKDIVREGSAARGTAYRSGMTQAELTPFNMALSFMGRQPFAPNISPTYPPDYKIDTAGLKMMGGGLQDMIKAGSNAYSSLFGPRETGASGFESTGVFPGATGSDLMEYGWD